MSRATFVINTNTQRDEIARWAWSVPFGTRVEFKETKRSNDQNAKMWACLGDISKQLPWHGIKLTSDDWKLVFLDALKREVRIVPNIDGNGFVSLGRSSSDLSIEEMADLITIITKFGDEHGVVFKERRAAA